MTETNVHPASTGRHQSGRGIFSNRASILRGVRQVNGTGYTTDALHTAFEAIAEEHFIPSIVDFYNTPRVRPSEWL